MRSPPSSSRLTHFPVQTHRRSAIHHSPPWSDVAPSLGRAESALVDHVAIPKSIPLEPLKGSGRPRKRSTSSSGPRQHQIRTASTTAKSLDDAGDRDHATGQSATSDQASSNSANDPSIRSGLRHETAFTAEQSKLSSMAMSENRDFNDMDDPDSVSCDRCQRAVSDVQAEPILRPSAVPSSRLGRLFHYGCETCA